MLDKIRSGINLFILFMFVVAFVYAIVVMIYNSFNSDNIRNTNYISSQNIDIYTTESNLIRTDYTTFFTLEDCVQEVIKGLHDNKTSEVYNILINDVKNVINKDKSKLNEYYNANFKYDIPDGMSYLGYQNVNNLKQVYKVDDEVYICVVTSLNDKKSTRIGIKLIDGETFLVSYLDI